jgi:hypothetical protein
MGLRSITAVACATVLLGAAGAVAQTFDRTTYVTFSGPVSIPGKTLPAGTYTFRLADSPVDRHIVQIFDREQAQLFATLLAVPAQRDQPGGEPVITFRETPADTPPALRYWYYAGETGGNEFVYPKAQAMTIARASGESVMAIDTDSSNVTEWKGTPERVTANAEPQPAQAATTPAEPAAQPTQTPPAATAAPTPMTAAPDQPAPTMAQTPTPNEPVGTSGRAEPSELPRTAGELPLVGLITLIALAGAFVLRATRKAVV